MGGNKEMLKIQAERLAVIYKLIGSSGNGVPETEFRKQNLQGASASPTPSPFSLTMAGTFSKPQPSSSTQFFIGSLLIAETSHRSIGMLIQWNWPRSYRRSLAGPLLISIFSLVSTHSQLLLVSLLYR